MNFSQYIGIPFKEHGRDHSGCDCWGLCRLIWKEVYGLEVPSFGESYAASTDGKAVGETLAANGVDSAEWSEIPAGQEREGDAVLMSGIYKVDGVMRRADMHVGVVIEPGKMIHVERGIDAAIGRYCSDPTLNRRVRGFYRHRNLV